MNNYHIPVLLQEVLEALRVTPGKRYIDATLGGGGHSNEIIKLGGRVLGIDVDEEALEHNRTKNSEGLIIRQGNLRKQKVKAQRSLELERLFHLF